MDRMVRVRLKNGDTMLVSETIARALEEQQMATIIAITATMANDKKAVR